MPEPAKITKYARLAQGLRAQIESGDLRPGDRLPSFAEMRTQHGASPLTVDRVFSLLERDSLIVRSQGSGTFVATRPAKVEDGEVSDGKLMALIVPSCGRDFFADLIRGAEEACQKAGFHLMVANSRGNPDLAAQQMKSLSQRAAGLCVLPLEDDRYETYNELLQKNLPVVFLDRALPRLAVPLCASDNTRGGYLAGRHLLDCECEMIYALDEGTTSSARERVQGFRRALREAGAEVKSFQVRRGPYVTEAAGYVLTRDLLDERRAQGKKGRFGIFAINEPIARGCYMAIKERGLRIPQDVSVVAYGDSNALFLDPPLSTVQQDTHEMGARGMQMLLQWIATDGRTAPRSIRLRPTLEVRGSSDPHVEFCRITQIMDRAHHEEEMRQGRLLQGANNAF